jgi:GNAT superfamily N-acetyltransferase
MNADPTDVPGFAIRHAGPDDVPLILSYVRKLADYEKLAHEMEATEQHLREHMFGGHAYAEVIFAEQDGAVVGFALFFHTFSTFMGKPGLYLEDLFVDPTARGNGYGKALMAYLARLAVQRGCGRFEWSVLNWNAPSIDFYLALGARPLDAWTVYRLTGEPLRHLAGES